MVRLVSLTAAAALLAVCLVLSAQAQSTGSGSGAPAAAPPAVPVQAAASSRRDVPVLLRNIASVQAFQSVLVRARVDGTLDKIFFTEGQDVKPGDRLAQINPRPYAAALALAQAKKTSDQALLANGQLDLSRYSNLVRSDFASRQQFDTQSASVSQLQAALKGDEANIAAAQLNLDFTNIISPLDGRVGLRLVDPGNLIHATDATGIITITQIHPIAVIFTLPQDNLPDIQAAMAKGTLPVLAFTSDDRTQLSTGGLLTIDNTIDTTTGTIRLKAVFANLDDRLWPGQFVNARLQIGVRKGALTVPSTAVQRGPSGLFVYVVKPDSTVAVQPIDVVQEEGGVAVIGKGLDDGVQVVTNGQSRLQNGVHVTVTTAKPTT